MATKTRGSRTARAKSAPAIVATDVTPFDYDDYALNSAKYRCAGSARIAASMPWNPHLPPGARVRIRFFFLAHRAQQKASVPVYQVWPATKEVDEDHYDLLYANALGDFGL